MSEVLSKFSCDHIPEGDSCGLVVTLVEQNAKLRELLAETLMDVHEYAEKYGIEPNYDAVNAHLDARMRELGIEATA